MKISILFSAITLHCVAAGAFAADTDSQVTARNRNWELAGAFTNDGYKIREGYWTGTVESGKTTVIEVNLYAGNSYWLTASTGSDTNKLQVTVFDEKGKQVGGNLYSESGRGAAGISPTSSGPYYVRLQLIKGDPSDVCFSYCYK